ncbi:hypothetical protein F5887DRAFT_874787, partial [Amanita rubescens]
KRAETRKCPVCDEAIPLRLLSRHVLLEEERVDGIIRQIGSPHSLMDIDDFSIPDGPGPSVRRSALKARKSLSSNSSSADSVEQATKIIQVIKRHRKQRHTKLRDLTRDLDDDYGTSSGTTSRDSFFRKLAAGEIQCPVCMSGIRGDEDVLEAHIDACLIHQGRRAEEERLRALEERDDVDQGAGHVGNVTGTGFHTRNPEERDVDDDVDIDGDDHDVYGEPQFTEGDVISVSREESDDMDQDVDIEIDGETEDDAHDDELKTLHDLVAEGRRGDGVEAVRAKMNEVMGVGDTERLDSAIEAARNKGDVAALTNALESKIKLLESLRVSSTSSLLCRICLDPYAEPTVSTGCWHTCCRECWLRCLGSTKLCPICKRITGATDLRRIYL